MMCACCCNADAGGSSSVEEWLAAAGFSGEAAAGAAWGITLAASDKSRKDITSGDRASSAFATTRHNLHRKEEIPREARKCQK